MKHDELKKQTELAIARLAAELDRGESASLKTFLAAMSRFHKYSLSNQLLIMFQRPDATHVAGFSTWKKLNRFVRKGEKGIAIVAPVVFRRKDANEVGNNENGERNVMRFRVVHVFDVTQTDGEPLPGIATRSGDPGVYTRRLLTLIGECGIDLHIADDLNGADGLSKGGQIIIRRGLAPADEFGVMVHELAHELLHRAEDRPAARRILELEAEAVAYVVSDAVGISSHAASADYIGLYNGKSDDLAKCMDRIRSASATIIGSILDDSAHPSNPTSHDEDWMNSEIPF